MQLRSLLIVSLYIRYSTNPDGIWSLLSSGLFHLELLNVLLITQAEISNHKNFIWSPSVLAYLYMYESEYIVIRIGWYFKLSCYIKLNRKLTEMNNNVNRGNVWLPEDEVVVGLRVVEVLTELILDDGGVVVGIILLYFVFVFCMLLILSWYVLMEDKTWF